MPGVVLAGLATIGFGLVLGPEAPLIVLGAGVAGATISLARRDTPPQALMLVAAAGSFAAMSFIFASPLIAAVILIEATAIGGAQAPAPAGPRAAGGRNRVARVARNRVVVGAEHAAITRSVRFRCPRSAT